LFIGWYSLHTGKIKDLHFLEVTILFKNPFIEGVIVLLHVILFERKKLSNLLCINKIDESIVLLNKLLKQKTFTGEISLSLSAPSPKLIAEQLINVLFVITVFLLEHSG